MYLNIISELLYNIVSIKCVCYCIMMCVCVYYVSALIHLLLLCLGVSYVQ